MSRRKKKADPRQLDGLLVLNKPSGPTSAACLNRIKHALGQTKIGHAGTLDPLAQGVLLVLLGQCTKLAPYLTEGEKTYSGELRLGVTTDTYDIEGAVTGEFPVDVNESLVAEAISAWTDVTQQEVPAYSAAKHMGKPLYSLARAGEDVPVKTKAVTVFQAEPLDVSLPAARFKVRCSAGTYIRSLVHSLGKRLGCGAVLTSLTREASLPFGLDSAHALDDVVGEPQRLRERVIPIEQALPHWPRVTLSEPQAALVKNGGRLAVSEAQAAGDAQRAGDHAVLLTPGGTPLALAEAMQDGGDLRWAILRGLWSDEARTRETEIGSAQTTLTNGG